MQEVSISTVDEYVKAICDIRKTFISYAQRGAAISRTSRCFV